MDADLDTLATELYVRTDDLLKAAPEWAPWRPATGIAPKVSDAELITMAVMQALLGYVSEARWLRHARKHLTGLFPYLPGQSGYNKRLRKLAAESIPAGTTSLTPARPRLPPGAAVDQRPAGPQRAQALGDLGHEIAGFGMGSDSERCPVRACAAAGRRPPPNRAVTIAIGAASTLPDYGKRRFQARESVAGSR